MVFLCPHHNEAWDMAPAYIVDDFLCESYLEYQSLMDEGFAQYFVA